MIIEDFWPRVLGGIMWFFGTYAWILCVIIAIALLIYQITR